MMKLNQKGQSLIQVMIGGAVGAIILMATLSTQLNQARENRALTEKLAALDIQRLVTATLGETNVCGYLIQQLATGTPAGRNVFDASLITSTASPPAINLGNILPTNGTPNSPAIATVGAQASPISQTVIVKAIEIANIKCPAPCTDPKSSNEFIADFQVTFDNNQLVRTIQPAKAQVVLRTTSSAASKTITGCSLPTNGGNPSGDFVVWY